MVQFLSRGSYQKLGGGLQQPPPPALPEGEGLAEKIIFFLDYVKFMCTCLRVFMTLNTNEKINFLYLLTFFDEIISCNINGCSIYVACQKWTIIEQ